jgi:hypothetical protein
VVSFTVSILYLIVTLLVEYCAGPGKDLMSPTCEYALNSSSVYLLYQSSEKSFSNYLDGLILSLYVLILDFILGSILFSSFLTVPAVKKVLHSLRGTRHLERYTNVARVGFWSWASLLTVLIILVFVEKVCPSVYNTTHIALILNKVNQLINTLQFFAAFQLLIAVEFLMKLGSGRKMLNSFPVDVESRSDPASDAHASSPSMQEMFRLDVPISPISGPSCDQSSDNFSPARNDGERG